MADAPPAWTEEQLALLADSRLPAAARIIGLMISLGAPEGMEFGRDDARALLGASDPDSDDTIRRLFRQLEATKWAERTPGGRGHSDSFRVLGPQECGSNAGIRVGFAAALKNRVGLAAALKPDRVGLAAALKPPSSTPPVPPPPPPGARARELDPDAARVIDERTLVLEGCRGPMTDYLKARVDPERQYAYVYRVVTALEGGDEWMWKDRGGHTLREGRTDVLAAAFNELLTGDEVGEHFPDRPGGFGNLRSKIRYLVASALGVEGDAAKNGGPRGPGRPPRTTIGIDNQGSLD